MEMTTAERAACPGAGQLRPCPASPIGRAPPWRCCGRRDTSWDLIRTVAGVGVALDVAATARAASPAAVDQAAVPPSTSINGLAVDADGRLYGADCYEAPVFRFDADGPVVVAGSGSPGPSGDGGPATAAELHCPFGPALDGRGMFIVDHGNDSIRLVDSSGSISTFAGPGPFHSPTGIAIDAAG